MSKARIPPAVAIRGCNTFREKTKLSDFIILNQVVSEKTLMKNVHMCYIRVSDGKIENLKKVKMRVSTLIFIYTIHFAYLKVYKKFHNPKSNSLVLHILTVLTVQ